MADPNYVVPAPGVNPFGGVAVVPVRPVRVLTQSLGVPELPVGGYTITGVVTFGGLPGANAVCSLVTDPGNKLVKQTTAAPDGTYTFTDLPVGRYQVLAYDPTLQYRSKVAHTIIESA